LIKETGIERSKKALNAAELLFENSYYDACVSRCYYSMFYLIQELFKKKEIEFSTHSGLISQFGLHYVKSGKVDKEYSAILRRGFERRMMGDYGQIDTVTREVARRSIEEARKFHERIMELIQE
jgi:uncharacterized protein (UPF0332 family)